MISLLAGMLVIADSPATERYGPGKVLHGGAYRTENGRRRGWRLSEKPIEGRETGRCGRRGSQLKRSVTGTGERQEQGQGRVRIGEGRRVGLREGVLNIYSVHALLLCLLLRRHFFSCPSCATCATYLF